MNGFRAFSILVCVYVVVSSSSSCYSLAFPSGDPDNQMAVHDEIARTAGYGDEKLSSVLVTGTILCEACLDSEAETRTWHVSGASVAVTCRTGRKGKKLNWAVGSTDEDGDFIIDLPSHLHAIPKLDKACTVRVLRLPKNSACRRSVLGKQRAIRLSSVGNGIRTYTTGTLRFQLKSKRVCIRKAKNLEEERSW